MHIVVCIKQILDPEISPGRFQIDEHKKEPVRAGASLVIGPFDLNAIEVAVQLKEEAGAKVTVLTAGPADSKEALKRALSIGCDEAVRVDAPQGRVDGAATARVLAAAIRKLEGVDVVLCGRQAGDWDQGMVGSLLAEELDMPIVPFARKAEPGGEGRVRLEREADGGLAVWQVAVPVVVTVTNSEHNAPRLPKVKDIMMAGRKPIQQWTLDEIGLTPGDLAPRVEVLGIEVPVREAACEFVEGETGAEKGKALVALLRERKAI